MVPFTSCSVPPSSYVALVPATLNSSTNSLLSALPALMRHIASHNGHTTSGPVIYASVKYALWCHHVGGYSRNRYMYIELSPLFQILRARFSVKCFLGLTATASKSTISSLLPHLNLTDTNSDTIKGALLPPNLNLSVSKDVDKESVITDAL